MSTRLDLPLLPSAEQIRRRMFARVRRGFDPDQVRDYLLQIADQIETLEGEVREARLASETPSTPPAPMERDPVSEMSERIADIVRTAERHSQERRAEVEEESRTILSEARAEADRIRLDAQSRAEELRQESNDMLAHARSEADRALGSLAVRRQDLVEEFRTMRSRRTTGRTTTRWWMSPRSPASSRRAGRSARAATGSGPRTTRSTSRICRRPRRRTTPSRTTTEPPGRKPSSPDPLGRRLGRAEAAIIEAWTASNGSTTWRFASRS